MGVDRFSSLGYHRSALPSQERKGNTLRKVFLLITGFLFLAGCGGLSMKGSETPPPPILPSPIQLSSSDLPQKLGTENEVRMDLSKPPMPASADQSEESFHPKGGFDFWEESLPSVGSEWPQCLLVETLPIPVQEEVRDATPPSLKEKQDLPAKRRQAKVAVKAPRVEAHQDSPPEKEIVEVRSGEGQNTVSGEVRLEPPALVEAEVPPPLGPPQESPEQSKAIVSAPNSVFPSLLNEEVGKFIDLFQTRADGFFLRALGRSNAYTDMMKKIFREKNLPEELVYLALIESGYNPKAFSRAKASGIWQFIAKTGKRFGLKVNKWVDERRDPEKSTYAAAAYLKNLYGIFNSWDLAAASYNAGEGKVLMAMRKAKSQDFWEISQYRYLKKETKEYVPMFLAAMTIAQDPQKYGFQNVEYHPPLLYEKVVVPPSTSLARIAKAAETDLFAIQILNPALMRGQTPPDSSKFEIKLPLGKKEVFAKNFKTQSLLAKAKKHRVRNGETLSRIAKKYRLSLEALCAQNGLSPQSSIKPGFVLLLPSS